MEAVMTRTISLFLLITILLATATPAFADSTYVVRSGDTLYSIARKFGVTVAAIARANNITNTSLIYVGQTLVIPSNASSSSGTSSSTGGNTGATGPCPRTYVVQRGETLRRIASKCGTTVAAIVAANGLGNPNLIYAGQVLTIPNGTTGSAGGNRLYGFADGGPYRCSGCFADGHPCAGRLWQRRHRRVDVVQS